jgi:hypothetical protein
MSSSRSQVAQPKRRWRCHSRPAYIDRTLVEFGEHKLVPRVFAMTFWDRKEAERSEALKLTVEVVGPADWRIEKIELTPAPDAAAPRDTFGGLPSKVIVDAMLAEAAILVEDTGRPGVGQPRAHLTGAERVAAFGEYQSISKPRRAVTRARVEQAAAVYTQAVEAGDRAPIQRVADALGIGKSMAARLIGMARKSPYYLLPATTRGKAQA